MKKTILLLAASFVFLGITSCEKAKDELDQLTEFDINYSKEVTIPSTSFTTVTTPVDINSPSIPTNASSNFSGNKTTADLVTEIKMTKLTVSNTSGNLDFLKNFSIYLNAPGQTEVLIATKASIPTGATSVDADMKDVNIKEYIKKDNISFRISALFQTGSANSINLKVDNTVHVKATLLK